MSRVMSSITLAKNVEIQQRDVKIEELKLEIIELKKLDQERALESSNLRLEMAQLRVALFRATQPQQVEQELATQPAVDGAWDANSRSNSQGAPNDQDGELAEETVDLVEVNDWYKSLTESKK